MRINKPTSTLFLMLLLVSPFLYSQEKENYLGEGPFSQLIIRGVTLINGNGAPPTSPVDIVVENHKNSSRWLSWGCNRF